MGSTYVVKGNQMLLGVWVWNDTLFCGVVVVLSDGYSFFFERELDLRNQDDIRTSLELRSFFCPPRYRRSTRSHFYCTLGSESTPIRQAGYSRYIFFFPTREP